eukprot:365814-Chlamydomonas_euryale.AAC.5
MRFAACTNTCAMRRSVGSRRWAEGERPGGRGEPAAQQTRPLTDSARATQAVPLQQIGGTAREQHRPFRCNKWAAQPCSRAGWWAARALHGFRAVCQHRHCIAFELYASTGIALLLRCVPACEGLCVGLVDARGRVPQRV